MLAEVVDVTRFEPLPPIHESVGGATKEWIFIGAHSTVFLVALGVAIYLSFRRRSPIPVLCMVGGVLCLYTEPMIDAHLQVWWPEHDQPDVFHAWGRDIGIMLIPILGWYFGAGTYVRWYFLDKYGSSFRVWWIYMAEVGAAIALEPAAIQLHLWHYYGFQGLRLFGYPIWWPFIGGACGVLAGTLIYKLTPYLKGWRLALVPPLVPMAVVAVYWSTSWPMFNALNTEAPHAVVYLCSALSVALAVLVVWICTIATGHREWLQDRKQEKQSARAGNGDGRGAVAAPEKATV